MTTPYSKKYHPPAPVLSVGIAIPDEAPLQEAFTALVDTGADGTFIPSSVLENLNLPVSYMTNVRSHLGERLYRVPVHKIDLILSDSIRLPSVEVVSDDFGEQIIIGRNVLNKLLLHLDGPKQTTKVTE